MKVMKLRFQADADLNHIICQFDQPGRFSDEPEKRFDDGKRWWHKDPPLCS